MTQVYTSTDHLLKCSSASVSTMSPPSSHIPKTRRNPLQRATDRVRLEYYRYEVTFGLYVMTPGEKLVTNSFVIVVFSLLFWALLLYFPPLLYQKLSRLVWLLTGHDSEMGQVLGIFDPHLHGPATAFVTDG